MVPQNGIKEAGMTALLESLKADCLEELDVSDNWIKGKAIDALCLLIKRSKSTLSFLNISDSTLGLEGSLKVCLTIASGESKLVHFANNYNEIENTQAWGVAVHKLIEACGSLKRLEAQGNELSKKASVALQAEAKEKGVEYVFEEEDEDDIEDEDEEGEDEDEEQEASGEVKELVAQLGALKL